MSGPQDITHRLERWQAGEASPPRFPRDLASEIRPQLIEIGAQINDALADLLPRGAPNGERLAKAQAHLSLDCLPAAEAGAIVDSLDALARQG